MVDIGRQIEIARSKPLTAENLNYIGDLYLKSGDRTRAVAYFFESVDKLHFAQKEKKLAIFKKIINISPVSEKAYEGIIEILSKMGLIMEEKRYLHMLAQLYETRGDGAKAEELFMRIKNLDPHVSLGGTFFHKEAHDEVTAAAWGMSAVSAVKPEVKEEYNAAEEDTAPSAVQTEPVSGQDKLIEATLEEVPEHRPAVSRHALRTAPARRYPVRAIIMVFIVLSVSLISFLLLRDQKGRGLIQSIAPVSMQYREFEITGSLLADRSELKGLVKEADLESSDFYEVTVRSVKGCLPDSFATAPYNMIMLQQAQAGPTETKAVEGLKIATRFISRMNVCGREEAKVFVRVVIALDRQKSYAGLVIGGLGQDGPLTVRWSPR